MKYTHFSGTFFANTSTTTLEFASTTTGAYGVVLDAVTVKAVPGEKDTAPPVIELFTAPVGTLIENPTYAGDVTNTGTGVALLEAQVDSGPFQPVAFDSLGQFTFTTDLATDGTADGPHVVRFQATDRAGNVSPVTTEQFTLVTRTSLFSFQPIDVPNASTTLPSGINDSGQIVGLSGDGGVHGFLLQRRGLHHDRFPRRSKTRLGGINDAGQMVGNYNIGNDLPDSRLPVQPWGLHHASTSPARARPPPTGSTPPVKFQDPYQSPETAFLYSGGSYTSISFPGAIATDGSDINDSSEIVGGYEMTRETALLSFLYSGGSYTTIDVPGSTDTFASGINDTGQIVGNYTIGNSQLQGFLYSGGTFTTLAVPGSIDTQAYGINNAGQIVGRYSDVNGNTYVFVATPIIP